MPGRNINLGDWVILHRLATVNLVPLLPYFTGKFRN